jgi:hypothetical protein
MVIFFGAAVAIVVSLLLLRAQHVVHAVDHLGVLARDALLAVFQSNDGIRHAANLVTPLPARRRCGT